MEIEEAKKKQEHLPVPLPVLKGTVIMENLNNSKSI